ncbi:hypothetical protein M409DRAFT_67614 [Zasmidium cellare ATCC 36951]|uniref:DNA polymerase delta subunit 3 n=1 Tax=Zasmidium cellare ATCC 36951 TaxID=1080233 RepID=A0A6A6CCZ2_ZASCE|nr:uncharacterized protein M409DRAFT_67614 [Zasmidium cellare ATCC 36951]KAF2164911.1 hypothetical protein M409DRAFT_67614 [Zasmidium cellare ATCC 36951]
MAQDYTEWLAVNVVNERQNVNYRNLSRALKVHCDVAKQMMYDFYHKQNSKKPGSVHATYLITGTKRAAQTNGVHSQEDGDDTVMRSSPPLPSSSIPQPAEDSATTTPIRSIMLVKEEHLDQAKELFEAMTSIHIYSLQANGLKDFQALTDCNRRVAAEYASEDPLKEWKKYGTIQNPGVRRKTRKTGPPPSAAPAAKPEPVKAKVTAAAAAKTSAAEIKESTKPVAKSFGAHAQPEGTSKPPQSKKESSSIFKSFAKGAAKPKKTDSQSSAAASPAPPPAAEPEDVPMTGFSDDELDDDQTESGLPDEEAKEPSGKSKKEREAELQAMMDQEDEPMEDADSPAADEEKHDEGAIDNADSQPKEEPKETVTVENGRRRGRRRVTKKKTVKDEDGYLVTREETAWESFSEDEPAPKKPKVQAPSTTKASAGKKGAKPGQGNIMSFFSKK